MLWGSNLILDTIISYQSTKHTITKIRTSIINDYLGSPKTSKHIFPQEKHDASTLIIWKSNRLKPLRYVINGYEDILILYKVTKGPMKSMSQISNDLMTLKLHR